MIFVTLGSQKFQFDRLLIEIDELIESGTINEEVFAQTGYSTYIPKNFEWNQFLNREVFNEYQEKADLIITHGGTGAIIGGIKKGKKVIAIPRLSQFGEHVDDHQIEIIKEFEKLGLISACYDVDSLSIVIENTNKKNFNKYVSNTQIIIKSIGEFIENVES